MQKMRNMEYLLKWLTQSNYEGEGVEDPAYRLFLPEDIPRPFIPRFHPHDFALSFVHGLAPYRVSMSIGDPKPIPFFLSA